MKNLNILFFIVVSILFFSIANAQEKKIGDEFDGSNAHPVHLIKLYDKSGNIISPNDKPSLPFSTSETCGGKCHNYNIISDGYHFNLDQGDNSSRNGEPWIYSDASTLTNLPLSYRGWTGTHNPNKVGIPPLQFLKRFGPYYPGGDISEVDSLQHPDNFFRWEVSGKLEVNCLICHDADPFYDMAEYATNMRKENFGWAASASSSITEFEGNASSMPDNFSPFNSTTILGIDTRTSIPPDIHYNKNKFNSDEKVFFNVTRKIPNERCFFCHSSNIVDERFGNEWSKNKDVHLTSGLNCVDCHKNGLDHDIIRGSESTDVNSIKYKYSCAGCHSENSSFINGTLGAPIPEHLGIPTIHFEKMECTVCHSSPLTNEKAEYVKTSRNHFLGMHGSTKKGDQFPHIQTRIFTENENQKLEPRNLVWPSFWGVENNGEIFPLDIKVVENQIRPILGLDTLVNYGNWPKISDSLMLAVFDTISAHNNIEGNIVFISGGKKYFSQDKLLSSKLEPIGNAYTWPVAHDVKPSAQSLGSKGCDDCHSLGSNFFDMMVKVESAYETKEEFVSVAEFSNINSLYQNIFSLTFLARPVFKIIILGCSVIILLLTISYFGGGLKSLSQIVNSQPEDKEGQD